MWRQKPSIIKMVGNPFYSVPARDLDEELVDKWAFQLRSSFSQEGLTGLKDQTNEIYSDSIESGNKDEDAAYNLGIAAARAYEDVNIEQSDWEKRINEGLNTGRSTRDADLRKVRELLNYGMKDREKLLEKGYDV